MRARNLLLAVAIVPALAGACSSSKSATPGTTSTAAPASGSSRAPVSTTTSPIVATGLRGKRYCEVLLVHVTGSGVNADVYNTYPLNPCPATQWAKLDARAIARGARVPLAVLNGPRYWLMDEIEKTPSKDQVRKAFGGMTMIREANVDVGPIAEALVPYKIHTVDRSTVFTFDAGTTVHELHAADGSTYVMQSWSQQVDAGLEQSDLARLGPRLRSLPAGWTYTSRRLTAPLRVVTTTTSARVLQDDFRNSYSFEGRS